MSFTALPAKEYVKGLASTAHTSPQLIEAAYGVEATQSDYGFLKRLYELTPEKMNYSERVAERFTIERARC